MEEKYSISEIVPEIGVPHKILEMVIEEFNLSIDRFYISPIDSRFNYRSVNKEGKDYLLKLKEFIIAFNKDFYADKTIESIALKTGRDEKAVEEYLRMKHPEFFAEKGKYPKWDMYPFRYVSSFVIDYNLGGVYSMLSLANTQ
jgi:hypothetical protein